MRLEASKRSPTLSKERAHFRNILTVQLHCPEDGTGHPACSSSSIHKHSQPVPAYPSLSLGGLRLGQFADPGFLDPRIPTGAPNKALCLLLKKTSGSVLHSREIFM